MHLFFLVIAWQQLCSVDVFMTYIDYGISSRWGELVLGRETSWIMKIVSLEEYLENIAKVGVPNGWQHHFLVLL